eukprot:Nk52_evm14s163 gene=Nk52_evmTU14s163
MGKTFTAAEVAEHSTHDNIWMIIADKVYDCTKFMDEHPGGEEVLLEVAGVDATQSFEDVGHSTDAREMLEDLYVGDLAGSSNAGSGSSSKGKSLPKAPAAAGDDGLGPFVQYAVPILFALAALAYKFLN